MYSFIAGSRCSIWYCKYITRYILERLVWGILFSSGSLHFSNEGVRRSLSMIPSRNTGITSLVYLKAQYWDLSNIYVRSFIHFPNNKDVSIFPFLIFSQYFFLTKISFVEKNIFESPCTHIVFLRTPLFLIKSADSSEGI